MSIGASVGDVHGADNVFLTPAELLSVVPEPSTCVLLTLGFAAIGSMAMRTRSALSAAARDARCG